MNMCPTNKCKTAPESCLKGQVFFIWTSCASAETLKSRISLLGGKVEQFLTKDVTTVLVEDNQLLVPELLSPEVSVKSTYSVNGTVVTSFPYPGGLTNIPSTSSGYNFIAANTSNKPFSPYRIICYARQWGIQVVGIAEFLTWTEPQIKSVIHRQKQRKPPENVSNLTGYFIKFESVNKNYRPCYKMFNNDPDRLLPLKNASVLANVLVPESCNVILSNPVNSKQLNFTHMDTFARPTHQVKPNLPVKANEKKAQNNKVRPKEENNYCECCKTHFADFRQHIKSSKHQSFVSNDKNYESVHNILKMLPTPQEFIENLQNPSPSADPGLTNGDLSHCLSGASVPDAEVSAPLNLQVRKDNVAGTVVPVIIHPERNVVLPQSFQVPKDEVMPLPLDLHIKREDEVKNEVIKIKQEPDVYVDVEQIDLLKKEEINAVRPKLEANNDLLIENIKVEEKQPVGLLDGGPCEEGNGDFLDRNNTAALAQLCLKNFDSYWLDSLPCEVDDMVFDDIFDFDDGKAKPDEQFVEPFVENSDVAQTPGLVSGLSTSNLKTQNTDNASLLMNTSIDVKDLIKVEPPDIESFPPPCSMGKENEALSTSNNVAVSLNESLPEDKKPIFSIASYCTDKMSLEPTPSCSTTVANKDDEPLFSSESSDDDENGNVLISNALHFITNSDNETKVGKESEEENTVDENLGKAFSLQNDSVSNPQKNKREDKVTTIDEAPNSLQLVQSRGKETSALVLDSSVNETDLLNNNTQLSNSKSNVLFDKIKVDSSGRVGTSRANVIQSSMKAPHAISEEESKYKNRSLKPDPEITPKITAKAVSSHVAQSDLPKGSRIPSKSTEPDTNNLKSFQETPKEAVSSTKEKEWDYTCNKIYKKYPIPLNRIPESVKSVDKGTSKESAGLENSSIPKQKCPEEKIFNKTSNEKYPNPKKNISLREKIVEQSNSEASSNLTSVASLENSNRAVSTIVNPGSSAESMKMGKDKNELKINSVATCSSILPVSKTQCDGRVDQAYYESAVPAVSFQNKGEFHSGMKYPTDLMINSSILEASSSQQTVSWENKMNPFSYGSVTPIKHSQLQERNKQESSKVKGSSYVPRTNFASVDSIVSDDRYFANPEPVTPTKNESPKGKDHSRTFSFKKHYMKQNQGITNDLNVSNANIAPLNAVSGEDNLTLSNSKVGSAVQNPQAVIPKIVSGETPIKVTENVTAVSNTLQTTVSSQNRVTEDKIVTCNKNFQSQVSLTDKRNISPEKKDRSTDKINSSPEKKDCSTDKTNSSPEKQDHSTDKTNSSPEKKDCSTDKMNSSPEKKDRSTDSNTSIVSEASIPTESTLVSPRHDFVSVGKCPSSDGNISSVIKDPSIQLQPSGATINSFSVDNRLMPNLYAEDLSMKPVNVPQKNDKNLGSTITPSTLKEGSSCIVTNSSCIKMPGVAINPLPGENMLGQLDMSANNPNSVQATVHKNVEKPASATSPGISKDRNNHTTPSNPKLKFKTSGGVVNSVVVENRLQPPAESPQPKQANTQRKSAEKLGSLTHSSTSSASALSCFKKVHNNFEHFIPFKRKRAYRKDKKAHKKIKREPISAKKLNSNDGKEQSRRGSINPCQYSYRTAKYNIDTSANSTSVKFTSLRRTVKIPPREKSQKRRELPPLWTVSVNGVKLKFTRIYPKKVDAYQYVTEDDSD